MTGASARPALHPRHSSIRQKYVAGRSGRVVMTEELLPAPIPASKAALREVILPLLDESDEPFDDDNLIDYGLDSVRMMSLAARWRNPGGKQQQRTENQRDHRRHPL